MQFKDRVKIYFIGVSMGMIIVYFLLIKGRDRDFGKWLPNQRVLEQLKQKPIYYDEKVKCILDCNKITDADIQLMLTNGDVNFIESSPRNTPPEYVIEGTDNNEQKIELKIIATDENSMITGVKNVNISVNCVCD